MDGSRFELDTGAVRRRFGRAAAAYDRAAHLQREVAQRMAARLDYVKIEPPRILDIGCGTGRDLVDLGARYPAAARIGFDSALPMLRVAQARNPWIKRAFPWLGMQRPSWVCGDAVRLPLCSAKIGLVWSNLMLHWVTDPLPAFREIQRVLEVGGLLMFSTLGPDTLREFRKAFSKVDSLPHVHRFIDMHDIGDMLVASGFAEPVMDMEVFRLTYADLGELLIDLRAAGATNAAAGRGRGLAGRRKLALLRSSYDALREQGRLPATFEVVYGHAWKARTRTTDDGRSVVSLNSLHRKPRSLSNRTQFDPEPADSKVSLELLKRESRCKESGNGHGWIVTTRRDGTSGVDVA